MWLVDGPKICCPCYDALRKDAEKEGWKTSEIAVVAKKAIAQFAEASPVKRN
jgi:hypothetical protein